MNHLHKRKASPFFLPVFFVGLLHLVIGCAGRDAAQRKFVLDTTEEKFGELKKEIVKLTEQLKEMKTVASNEVKVLKSAETAHTVSSLLRVNPQPSLKKPIEKLIPDFEDEDFSSKEVLGTDEASIADSGNESMHYYLEGLELLEEKKYEEALQSLRHFVKENPQHVYADRAQFLISDTHFKNKEYGLVIIATNLLEARYPYSFRLPEALYKRALAFASLSQSDQARTTFQNLLKRYPSDPFSESATRQLAQLSRGERMKNAPPLMPEKIVPEQN